MAVSIAGKGPQHVGLEQTVSLDAIIFSHSEGCLFTLLTVSFAEQKLLSLIRLGIGLQAMQEKKALISR